MSIERGHELIRFECDSHGCHHNFESDNEEFADAWREAKSDGWVVSRGTNGWQHHCPSCKKELGDD